MSNLTTQTRPASQWFALALAIALALTFVGQPTDASAQTPPPATLALAMDPATPQIRGFMELSGTLRDTAGQPVAGATLSIEEQIDGSPQDATVVTTDAQGAFTTEWLVAGSGGASVGSTYGFTVRFAGDAEHGAQSQSVAATVADRTTHLTLRLPLTDDLFDYGIDISKKRYAGDDAQAVILSRIDTFADSLAGTPLTRLGPMLHTHTNEMPEKVRAEIDRVLVPGGVVYVLGGPAAISEAVATGLTDNYTVRRLFGATRIETSIAIADEVIEVFGSSGGVLLARAFGPGTAAWADAVSSGGAAAAFRAPILLTRTESLDPAVHDALVRYSPIITVLLGGEAALSSRVMADVPSDATAEPRRVKNRTFGATRDGTAVAIARDLWFPTAFGIAIDIWDENGWIYGLAAAGLSSDLNAPLIPARTDRLASETIEWLQSCDVDPMNIYIMGGENYINANVRNQLHGMTPPNC